MKKILMTGSNGLVGKSLKNRLIQSGYQVYSMTRHAINDPLYCNFKEIPSNLEPFEGFDVLIHLAGESIAGFRWTLSKKNRLLKERVKSSEILKSILLQLKKPPKQVFVATGVGFYGIDHIEEKTENSPMGEGFLAQLAYQIESVWKDFKIPSVMMRFATVLSKQGGAVGKLSLPWRFHCVPYYGNKQSFFPYVSLNELVEMIHFLVGKENLKGPINFCSDQLKTQEDLFSQMTQNISPKWSFVIPRSFIKLFLGQMGKETLLLNLKVIPYRLKELNYPFKKSWDRDLTF